MIHWYKKFSFPALSDSSSNIKKRHTKKIALLKASCTCCTISKSLRAFDNRIWITSQPSWTCKAAVLGIESKPQRFQFASSNVYFNLLVAFMGPCQKKESIEPLNFRLFSEMFSWRLAREEKTERAREREREAVIRHVSGSGARS